MSSAINKIKSDVNKSMMTMRYDPFLTDADWELVQEKSVLGYPYKDDSKKGAKARKSIRSSNSDEFDAVESEQRDLEEARQRSLNALKTSFAKQRNDGLISDDAVTVLNQAVNSVQEEHQSSQIASLNQLKRNWKVFGFFPKLASLIDGYLYNTKDRKPRNPWRRQFLRKCYRTALSDWYEAIMQLVIIRKYFLADYCTID